MAEKILPYAKQSDSRLLCMLPKEILDQYDIEYDPQYGENGESERIINYTFVGCSDSDDEEGEHEMGEEEFEELSDTED